MLLKNCLLLALFTLFSGLAANTSTLKAADHTDNSDLLTMFLEADGLSSSDSINISDYEEHNTIQLLHLLFPANRFRVASNSYYSLFKYPLITSYHLQNPILLVSFHNLPPPYSI